MGIFLFLTVIAIFNSYLTIVYNRSYTFPLQRVIGVSKARIILTFVFEGAVKGRAVIGALLRPMSVVLYGVMAIRLPQSTTCRTGVPGTQGVALGREPGVLPIAVGAFGAALVGIGI
jgi:ABC-type lipoprotein release transport system permease subunit